VPQGHRRLAPPKLRGKNARRELRSRKRWRAARLPPHITRAPPKNAEPAAPACLRNSLKKETPEDAEQAVGIPQRKRDAQADVADGEMVIVLATAQRQPASKAQMIKCGARRTSARTMMCPGSGRGRSSARGNADDHD